MPSTPESLLRAELQATGENATTWGIKTNNNIHLLAEAIAGVANVNVGGSGNYTLTASNYVSDEARPATLVLTGTLSGNRDVIVPTSPKQYVVRNQTSGAFTLTIRQSAGTGVAIPQGTSHIVCTSTTCVDVIGATGFGKTLISATSATAALNTLGASTAGLGLFSAPNGAAVSDIANTAEVNIVSAATTDIGSATSPNVRITSTNTITSFGTAAAGVTRELRFADALTLTYNATSLILPGQKNIVTTAGATATAVSLGSGNWVVTNYQAATIAAEKRQLELPTAGPMGWRNRVINGDFRVWQRGTNINVTTDLQRTADRWNISYNGTLGTLVTAREALVFSLLPTIGGSPFMAFIDRTTVGSGNTFLDFSTQVEGVRTFAGKTVTISAWWWLTSGQSLIVKTEQFFGGGGGSSPVFNDSPTYTGSSSWQRLEWTVDIASIAGKTIGSVGDDTLNVIFSLPPNNTFQFYVTDVQIEEGIQATPFERRPLAVELAMCQRYFQKSYGPDVAPGFVSFVGANQSSQSGAATVTPIRFNQTMRINPTITLYNPSTGGTGTWRSGGTTNVSATAGDIGQNGFSVNITGGTTGATLAGHWTADAEV